MSKVKWGVLVPILVVVLSGLGYLFKRSLERPAALLGYIDDPPGKVAVILDSGLERDADDLSGFFRFENVPVGEHNLRFQNSECWPQAVMVDVGSPGDNYLAEPVQLVRLGDSDVAPPVRTIRVTSVPTRTSDGRAPWLSVSDARILSSYLTHSGAERTGWVNLGTYTDGRWTERRASVGEELPAVGEEIQVVAPGLLWSTQPSRMLFGNYNLGEVDRYLSPGDSLEVSGLTTTLGQDQVWAQVIVKPPSPHDQ